MHPLNVSRNRSLIPIPLNSETSKEATALLRFLASVDMLAAWAIRQANPGWNFLGENNPVLRGISQVLQQQKITKLSSPISVSTVEQLLHDWVDAVYTQKEDALSPLLWIWTSGGGGCMHIQRYNLQPTDSHTVPQQINKHRVLTPVFTITSHPKSILEVDLCHYNLDGIVSETLQVTVLKNLPGEFMLLHSNAMPKEQWQHLRTCLTINTGLRRILLLGPTASGKFDQYYLVSWIDSSFEFWEWSEAQQMYLLHSSETYSTSQSLFNDIQTPLLTRWKKLA
jgi:hypothetical protein